MRKALRHWLHNRSVEAGSEMARLLLQGRSLIVPYPGMKTTNGTTYHEETPDEVIRVLESARQNRTRLHISLGDTASGRDFLEEFETHGYVGRSMGPMKVPLLVSNTRSLGGGSILAHCIVRIRESAGGRVLYQHPGYHHGRLEIRQRAEPLTLRDGRILRVEVVQDGDEQAAFEDVSKARRYIQKLGVRAEIVV